MLGAGIHHNVDMQASGCSSRWVFCVLYFSKYCDTKLSIHEVLSTELKAGGGGKLLQRSVPLPSSLKGSQERITSLNK